MIYAPDGGITGVHHAWAFDDMFSTFVIKGLRMENRASSPVKNWRLLPRVTWIRSKNSPTSLMLLQMERRFR